MTAKGAFLAAATVLLACGSAQAAFDEWAIGAKIGTLGIGGDLTTNLIPQVNLRAGAQWLGFSFDAEFSGVDYNVDLNLLNPLLLLDWYPFNGSFRISAGALYNASNIQLRGRPMEDVEIGDQTYHPEDLGAVEGDVEFEPIVPYVGIGWGNAPGNSGHWGLATDFGVAFIGSPNLDLSATGPIASDPTFQAELAKEKRDIEEDLSGFNIYLVLSISLFYRF
ncbi:MAG: hypothetical protein JW955_22830 [Sedimentisphaerales bacterium]|nr:hypothetical protein [Sedimentisphaerales bacterium]